MEEYNLYALSSQLHITVSELMSLSVDEICGYFAYEQMREKKITPKIKKVHK